MKYNFLCLVGLLLLFIQQSVLADPSDTEPYAGIDVRVESELAKEVEALYLAAKKSVDKFNAGEPAAINGSELGKTGHAINLLRYKAGLLAALGETAGVDYGKRQIDLKGQIDAIGRAFQSTKNAGRTLQAFQKAMATSRFKALIAKLRTLEAEKQWEQAETILIEVYEIVDPVATILVSGQPYQSIDATRRTIEGARTNQATVAASKLFTEQRDMEAPDFDATLTLIQQAIQGVGAAGKAQWEGAEVTGPQLVEKIRETWAKTQAAAIRTRTLDLLKAGGIGKASPFETACNKFGNDIVAELGKLIEADAARIDLAGAEQLYTEYLKALAPVARQTDNLQQKLDPALEKLVAKSPELTTKVNNYKLATDDLLFWRKRSAETLAAQKLAAYPLLTQTHVAANTSTRTQLKIYPQSSPDPDRAVLTTSAPALILNAAPALVGPPDTKNQGAKVTCADLIRYESSKGLSSRVISRYAARCFVTVPILAADKTTVIEYAASDLKADLMVSNEAPALSLQSAYAVATSERADLMKVGGDIYEVYLESLVTRFGNLKDSAFILHPLGRINIEEVGNAAPSHILMRYGVDPHWVQHDYFFVDGLKQEGS